MKLKLLISALFISGAAFAQEPIPAFYTFNGGVEEDVYTFVSSPTPIDQSATGANIAWNFSQLTTEGQSFTAVTVPTATEVAAFPGSTMLVRTLVGTNEEDVTNYYLATSLNGGYSITGFQSAGTELNYSTDNGFIGNFPLSYGYSNTDDIAGTFQGMGYNGSFVGTATSIVDAYGTLTLDDFREDIPVTRLKTVQDVALTYFGLPAGTVTQTIYSYYSATLANPIARSITTTINIPLLLINQTTSSLEAYTATALGTKNFEKTKVFIAPNPVANILHFSGDKVIAGVTITDASGRVVLESKAGNDIAVNHLSAGVYYVAVQSGTGTQLQKMVKQ